MAVSIYDPVVFVVFLSDTDEYRPPVWKSYCKYLNGFFFFPSQS
uniref:Uncharacterized protein n=1 Tax=Otus sunia TaxID=257818 RepID=A0A8C8AQQ3_9STRI